MKENKGITLIALIVTIIVLLILAAVSIATLMGKNGVITNAQKTSTENAYYGAEEQVKLAYMAVRTEIMSQVVADGTYDARLATNVEKLAQIVKEDLSDASSWEIKYTGDTVDSTTGKNKEEKDGLIYIKYIDTKIDRATINNTAGKEKPANEGCVYYTITIKDQNATLEPDLAGVPTATVGTFQDV